MQQWLKALPLATTLCLTSAYAVSADYQVDTLVDGLQQPWSIAFLPDGDMLVTEKTGQLLRIDTRGERHAIDGVPEVYVKSQGGLLDVALDPEYNTSQWVYLSYAGGDADDNRTTVVRARLNDDVLTDLTTLLEVSPGKDTAAHYGGKLAFMTDGSLLVSVGEGFEYREHAQDLSSEMGKLLRIHRDGSIPTDNPFGDKAPRVYSYGHRNPQGLAVHPETGVIYMTEHGPKGGDELNRIEPGNNYGWPAITYGVDYSGAIISPFTEAEGMEQPLRYWVPSIALSGLAIYRGEQFPELTGDALIGALRDGKLYALEMNGDEVGAQSEPFPEISGRVRDVRVGPEGAIYALTDEGKLFRVSR